MIKIGGSVRCSQSAGPTDPCARLLGPAPTCVQLPAVRFSRNRWRRNGKSLSPLAGPAFFFFSLFSLPPPTVSQPFKAAVTLMPPHFSKGQRLRRNAVRPSHICWYAVPHANAKLPFFCPTRALQVCFQSGRKKNIRNAKRQIGFELKKKKSSC